MIKILKDLGMRYNETSKRNFRWHLVKCECNCEWETRNATRIEHCSACGNKKAGKKREVHGKHNSKLYAIHQAMLQRCYNKNHKSYNLYGGKNVTVCDEWKNDFSAFEKWALENGYSNNLDLDKDELCEKSNIYPKIYSPKTCVWKTKKENSKSNLRVTPEQESEIVSEYLLGIMVAKLAKKHEFTWNGIKSILIRNSVYKTGKK